jgi:disulfide bond formation protein DsbB
MRIERILSIGATGVAAAVLLTSVGVLAIVYASQYWGGLEPCELCLYQRWPWWIAIGLGFFAVMVVRQRALSRLATGTLWRLAMGISGLTLMAGAVLAVYHVGIEQHWWLGPTSCTANATPASLEELKAQIMATPVVLCDQIAWSLFGISLAGYNAIASFVVGAASLAAVSRLRQRESS